MAQGQLIEQLAIGRRVGAQQPIETAVAPRRRRCCRGSGSIRLPGCVQRMQRGGQSRRPGMYAVKGIPVHHLVQSAQGGHQHQCQQQPHQRGLRREMLRHPTRATPTPPRAAMGRHGVGRRVAAGVIHKQRRKREAKIEKTEEGKKEGKESRDNETRACGYFTGTALTTR